MDANENQQTAPPAGQLSCNFTATDATRTEWNPKLPLVKLQTSKGGSNSDGAGPAGIVQLSITDPAMMGALSTIGANWSITFTPTAAAEAHEDMREKAAA